MQGRCLPRNQEGKQQWEKGSNSSGAQDRQQQFQELGAHQGLGWIFFSKTESRRRKVDAFISLGTLPAPHKHPVSYQHRLDEYHYTVSREEETEVVENF